jgi:hypothetical protein
VAHLVDALERWCVGGEDTEEDPQVLCCDEVAGGSAEEVEATLELGSRQQTTSTDTRGHCGGGPCHRFGYRTNPVNCVLFILILFHMRPFVAFWF